MLDDVLHSVVAQSVVQGHGSDALAVGTLLGKHPFGAVLREQADHAVAGHLVQVLDGLVSRMRKTHFNKTFADAH